MIKFDVDIREVKEILDFMNAFRKTASKIITSELHRIAIDVRNDMLKSMRNTVKSGGVSVPGYPPAIQSGNLINRIFVDKGFDYSKVYTDNIKYAKWLEEGTTKMEERPFFEPAIERSHWKERIINRIIAERFAGRRLEL